MKGHHNQYGCRTRAIDTTPKGVKVKRIEGRNPPKRGHSNDFALLPMKYCEKDQINIKRTTIILTNHINYQKTNDNMTEELIY